MCCCQKPTTFLCCCTQHRGKGKGQEVGHMQTVRSGQGEAWGRAAGRGLDWQYRPAHTGSKKAQTRLEGKQHLQSRQTKLPPSLSPSLSVIHILLLSLSLSIAHLLPFSPSRTSSWFCSLSVCLTSYVLMYPVWILCSVIGLLAVMRCDWNFNGVSSVQHTHTKKEWEGCKWVKTHTHTLPLLLSLKGFSASINRTPNLLTIQFHSTPSLLSLSSPQPVWLLKLKCNNYRF